MGKEQFERKVRRVVTQAGAITWDGKPVAVGANSPEAVDELALLTHEARTGSDAAFSALFERFQSPIVNYIYRLVSDWDAANDLAQDTFLKAYNALPRTEESLQISPWLYRIATNTALDSLRRRKRITWVPFSLEMEPVAPMSDYAPRHADQDSIQRALHAVPADQRTCLVLNMYQGLSYKEIAETLGISVNLVAVRIFRGREKFIEAYKKANPAE
ncbi:MAG TPA: sigma-70 family RNA polymerase sigma factor [Chloroflexia bacterium]|nr:sigma-70 family RNA polymerase sigma factor [Chloroflexia bacterium]